MEESISDRFEGMDDDALRREFGAAVALRVRQMRGERANGYAPTPSLEPSPPRDPEAERAEIERGNRLAYATFLDRGGMPRRLIERVIDGKLDRDAPAFTALVRATGESKIAVLSGPPGCGKSCAACMYIGDVRISFRFLSAWTRTRASVYEDDAEEWANVAVLVLDDVGEEYQDAKGFTAAVLDQLVTERYDQDRLTIITTNLPAVRFKERYGERLADRIREVGAFCELAVPSYRGKTAVPPAVEKER